MPFDDGDQGDGHRHHGAPELGSLVAALSAGMGYAGHSISLADALAVSIAIQVALDHGGGPQLHGFQSGYLHDLPAFRGPGPSRPDGPYQWQDAGRQLELPGIARDATTVEVLGWPHGRCEPWPWQRVRMRASSAGLERYRPNIAGLEEFERPEPRLLMALPFGDPRDAAKPPNGWYRGAVGTTYIWRDFHWVPPKRPLFGKPKYSYENHRTFLVVTGAMWHYSQLSVSGDYETKVAFAVYSLPLVDETRQWTYRWDQIRRYRGLAERLAAGLKEDLEAYPPSAESIESRRGLDPALTRPRDS